MEVKVTHGAFRNKIKLLAKILNRITTMQSEAIQLKK